MRVSKKKTVEKSNGASKAKVHAVRATKSAAVPTAVSEIVLGKKYEYLKEMRVQLEELGVRISAHSAHIQDQKTILSTYVTSWAELDKKIAESVREAAKENSIPLEGQNWKFTFQDLKFEKVEESKTGA